MKTYYPRGGSGAGKWYVIDAADVPLGRLATRVAMVLRGKHRPDFTPHLDLGDHVVVINAGKVVLTGKKREDKVHYYHTGYPGGIRAVGYGRMLAEKPGRAVELAVRRMLPKNRLGRSLLRKLRVYREGDHPHAAQMPEALALDTKRGGVEA